MSASSSSSSSSSCPWKDSKVASQAVVLFSVISVDIYDADDDDDLCMSLSPHSESTVL